MWRISVDQNSDVTQIPLWTNFRRAFPCGLMKDYGGAFS
jgi:hypothetical protein